MQLNLKKLNYLSNLLKGHFEPQEWEFLITNYEMREDLANLILKALDALKQQTQH